MKRTGLALVAIACTAGFLFYAFRDADFHRLGALLLDANFFVLPPFLLALALFFLFTALRWQLILHPLGRFHLKQAGPSMMIGFAGNNILPAHLGELVRAVVFSRLEGLSTVSVLSTILVERVFDVLAILFFYVVAVLAIHPFPASISLGADAILVLVLGIFAGFALFLRFPGLVISIWNSLSQPFPAALQKRGETLLGNVMEGISALNSPSLMVLLVLYSLLKWLMAGVMVWLSMAAFGAWISFTVCLIVVGVTALAITVPSAPGYFGSIQAAFVISLVPFDVSREMALVASIYFLLAQWFPVTLVGAVFFLTLRLNPAQTLQEAERFRSGTGKG